MRLNDFGAIVLGVIATIVVVDKVNEYLDSKKEETEIRVCIEYFDAEGHRIRECDLK